MSSEARAARQQDEAIAEAMKQHKASLQALVKGFNSWQERVEAVNRVSAELKANQDPAAIKVAQIFERGLEEAEATLKSYLTNDNKTPIASLTQAKRRSNSCWPTGPTPPISTARTNRPSPPCSVSSLSSNYRYKIASWTRR